VGQAKKPAVHSAHGAEHHLRFIHFHKLSDAVAYLRRVRGASICGCEIGPGAEPVQMAPFRAGTTALLMGNEGRGLSDEHAQLCDHLVYIPQYSGATASLNVNAACAVVLHHFALWAGLQEHPKTGAKFDVAIPGSTIPRSGLGLSQARTMTRDGVAVGRMR
jgi:tRNA C32,U32 (ribose-2'-O)-methylase TrmJ